MSHSTTPDYYELLGVPRDADSTVIAAAYRRLARVSHPDSGGNAGMFRLLRTAYETLTDDAERGAYDATLDGHTPVPEENAPDQQTDTAWRFTDGTARSMVIDPQRLSWWPAVDPNKPTRVEPPYGEGRVPVVCAVFAFVATGGVMTYFHLLAVVPLVVGLLAITASFARTYRGVDVTVVAGVSSAVALVCTGTYMYFVDVTSVMVLGFALLGALVASMTFAHRFGRSMSLDRLAPPQAIEQSEYGHPGAVPGAVGEEDDELAERVGSDALLPLTFMPGVRVFHGLVDPTTGSVVSHAVVCGRLVALVRSKQWDPGTYVWTSHGALLRDGHHFPAGDLGFDSTVAAFQQALGDRIEVRGFVLVTPTTDGQVVGCSGPTGVSIGGPQAVVDEIGGWFVSSGNVDLVDRRLLVSLYGHRAVDGVNQ